MEHKKVCPLRTVAGIVAQGAPLGRAVLPDGWDCCMGPACAWYDAARECCAVLEAAKSLRALSK